ncbi:MAG: cytochrome c peroxidase [Planctomycetota bacterium]
MSTLQTPLPANLGEYVQDNAKAIELGKALFWDAQMGSDGMTACATCHYAGGADNRDRNQGHPGALGMFQNLAPNQQLTHDDFPLHKLADPDEATSGVLRTSTEVIGSQGVHKFSYNGVSLGLDGTASGEDDCSGEPDLLNNVLGTNVRQTTGRNAPSAINAIHYVDAFWDGRARSDFNGADPGGQANPDAVVQRIGLDGEICACGVTMKKAALASQSVGPPLSGVEMSGSGRSFCDLGKKACALLPLANQMVAADDSVLGGWAMSAIDGGPGLATSYVDMIQAAFRPDLWASDAIFDRNGNVIGTGTPQGLEEFAQMEINFSMIWGISVMLYESTLISDQTRFDQWLAGNTEALTPEEENGMDAFYSGGTKCAECHTGPLLSSATWGELNQDNGAGGAGPVVDVDTNGTSGIGDKGYFNIALRPVNEDIGRAAVGNHTWTAALLAGNNGALPSAQLEDITLTDPDRNAGAFKTPTLRNVELTGPYFHNGSQSTLLQVVQFYTRGGDFGHMFPDTTSTYIDPIGKLNNKLPRQQAVVAFMKSLTDERVRWERAPFDHPELAFPNGAIGDDIFVESGGLHAGESADNLRVIPAVGAGGRTTEQGPVPGFLNITTGSGAGPLGGVDDRPVADVVCFETANGVSISWTTNTPISMYVVEIDHGGLLGMQTFNLGGAATSFVDPVFRPEVTGYVITPYFQGVELESSGCFIRRGFGPGQISHFLRGDMNLDGLIDLADAIDSLQGIFSGGSMICHDSADWNDDGAVDVSDPISTLSYLFGGGPTPALPYPQCGSDPTIDTLDCGLLNSCP